MDFNDLDYVESWPFIPLLELFLALMFCQFRKYCPHLNPDRPWTITSLLFKLYLWSSVVDDSLSKYYLCES